MPYISMFNGNDYEYWSLRMKTFLKAMDLWDVIEKGIPQEPTHETPSSSSSSSSSTTTSKEAWEQWMVMKDSYALNLIQNTISQEILPWIACAKSSKEAWEILQVRSLGGPMFRNRKLFDLEKYYKDIAMGVSETIHEFIGRLLDLVFHMKSCGWKVQDQEVVKKILSSLHPRFDQVIVEIAETLSIDELVDCLLVHEYNMMRPVQESFNEEESFVEIENGDVEEGLQGDQGEILCSLNEISERQVASAERQGEVLSLVKHNQRMLIQLQKQMEALMQQHKL